MALVDGFVAADDHKDTSCLPAALLFNPALNLRYAVKDAKGDEITAKISPTKFLTKKAPPTWLLFGDSDTLLVQAKENTAKVKEVGADAVPFTGPMQPHGFFNRSPYIEATTHAADAWLVGKGFLNGKRTLKPAKTATLEKP